MDKKLGQVLAILPINIRSLIEKLPIDKKNSLTEIRLRIEKPLVVQIGRGLQVVTEKGLLSDRLPEGHIVTATDIQITVQLVTESSIYAFEEELRSGFVTISGGHRVGFVGKTVLVAGKVKTLTDISGLNIRISREIKGVADSIIQYLVNPDEGSVFNTLVISPPGCGKTTLVRDISRQLSGGFNHKGLMFKGIKVAIVDERSEIAGVYRGIPQHDVGMQTDVLDACPKAEGMLMMIRSMSPDVIITDEIGRQDDVLAIREALNAGVKVITTVHGGKISDLRKRPFVSEILDGVFQRYVCLGQKFGPGSIEAVLDETGKNLYAGR